MSRAHNSLRLDGQRFGHLIVVRRDGTVEYGADKQGSGWVCQCDCGREIVVVGFSTSNIS